MIYILSPEVSEINDEIWQNFYKSTLITLKKFRPQNIIEVSSLDGFSLRKETSSKDLLIFFNPKEECYDLEKILEEAHEKEMNIFPIAVSKEIRIPPDIVSKYQSFDLEKEKEIRGLDNQYINLIGECFGREIIIKYHPALFNDYFSIFLSHKRDDFEDESKLFKTNLHENKEKVFIDTHEIEVGDKAQEEIEAKLKEETDILIFIQTAHTHESEYQILELKKAFELSIPILWVTVNLNDTEIKKLSFHPAGKPHYKLDKLTPENINKIANCAFDLIKLKKQRLLDDILYKFNYLKNKGILYEEICDKDNIYKITKKMENILFCNKITIQFNFFKCLCRKYKNEDLNNFKNYIEPTSTENYILALKNESKELEPTIFLANYDDFLQENNLKKIDGAIIISGSFPDKIDLKYQQNVIDALYIFTKEILNRGGKIIFGSHPTFQGIILEIAKNYNSLLEKKVKVYVSKYFEGKYDLGYLQENSEVFQIEKDSSGDINISLHNMREAMISDKDAIALICIGGKELGKSLTEKTGLDEEIELAKKRNLKVFLLGSTGGRCKELLQEGFKNPIENLKLSKEVTYGNNFKSIINIILDELGRK